MSDIVKRLRHMAKLLGVGGFDIPALLNDAADVIERQGLMVAELHERVEGHVLRTAEACDLLAERKYGNPARSPGHNARLVLERSLSPMSPSHSETP